MKKRNHSQRLSADINTRSAQGVLTCQSVSDHGEGSSPPTTQQVIATLKTVPADAQLRERAGHCRREHLVCRCSGSAELPRRTRVSNADPAQHARDHQRDQAQAQAACHKDEVNQ